MDIFFYRGDGKTKNVNTHQFWIFSIFTDIFFTEETWQSQERKQRISSGFFSIYGYLFYGR